MHWDPEKPLEYSAEYFKVLLEAAKRYSFEYAEMAGDQRVFPDESAFAKLDLLYETLPEKPSDPLDMLRVLHEYAGAGVIPTTGGRYFGFVNGGALPSAVAAKWITDLWDQNGALYMMSPITGVMEDLCEKWLVDLLGLPDGTAAGFVSGTSTALMTGFVAARNQLLAELKWDVATKGLFGAPNIRIIVGENAHGTVFKALSFIGLGRERVEVVPSDEQGRMIPEKIPALDSSCLLIVQAGNVDSGAFDPLDEICDKANKAGAWVHVDGAFGLWAAASRSKKHLIAGIEKANSYALDAHKTLNAPYDSGIVLCRNRAMLVNALQTSGSYLHPTIGRRDGSHYSPELSHRARAIEIWAILKTLGRLGVEQLIDQLCERAQSLAEGLRSRQFEVMNDVVFNQIIIVGNDDQETEQIMLNIQNSGEIWCGGTKWRSRSAIRISVCSWATTQDDIERTVNAFCRAREEGCSK